MRSGSRELHWDTVAPQHAPRQRHESPKTGDSRHAIERAAGEAFDANESILAGDIRWAHWPTPAKNGYTRVVRIRGPKKGQTRRMTPFERRRHGNKWGSAGIDRWRRPNGEPCLTEDEALALCVHHHALPIRETKSPAFGTDPRWFKQSVAASERHGVPAWYKVLPTMRKARGKVVFCRAAGGQMFLIYGRGVRGRLRRLLMTRRVAKFWTVKPNGTW